MTIEIDGVRLVCTCGACPEQYDAFIGGEQVGYLRLRHGEFRVRAPNSRGAQVYEAEPMGDGEFEADERDRYLGEAVAALLVHWWKGRDGDEHIDLGGGIYAGPMNEQDWRTIYREGDKPGCRIGHMEDDAVQAWRKAAGRAHFAISPDLRSAFDRYKVSMDDGVDVSERVEASSNFNVVAFNMIAKMIEAEEV